MDQLGRKPMRQSDIERKIETIEKIKAAYNSTMKKEPEKFVPAPRVRNPRRGWCQWEKHKAKQAARRKAGNRRARQTRKAQRRAS